jgi:acyl dehydratase
MTSERLKERFPMREFMNLDEIKPLVGQEIAVSEWILVDQQRINLFAQATGDFQWIHLDAERSAKGPFGTTIAHGFLTLSMIPIFMAQAIKMNDVKMGVNYGLNKVRFTSPVPVNSELRAHFKLLAIEDIANNGAQMNWEVIIERKGSDKPVCIAESISRRYA